MNRQIKLRKAETWYHFLELLPLVTTNNLDFVLNTNLDNL